MELLAGLHQGLSRLQELLYVQGQGTVWAGPEQGCPVSQADL